MGTVVITPPAAVVSLAEAKRQLWIDADDTSKDDIIQPMIDAATALIDGPAGWLGRCLGLQTLEYRGQNFCHEIVLPFPPAVSVLSVKYLDLAGAEQTVDPSAYVLEDERLSFPAWQLGTSGVREHSLRIQYQAGYATPDGSPGEIPAPIKQAILMTVATLYENREASGGSLSGAAALLLAPYRVFG